MTAVRLVTTIATLAMAAFVAALPGHASASASLDQTFGTSGLVRLDQDPAFADAIDATVGVDGSVLVVGRKSNPASSGGADFNVEANTSGLVLAKYRPDGSLDGAFGDGGRKVVGIGSGQARGVQLLDDGKMLVVGGGSSFSVKRLLSDGTADPGFAAAAVTQFRSASDSVVQPDGKVVVAAGGSNGLGLVRFNPDGSLDSSFSGDGIEVTDLPPAGPGEAANAVALQPDGKILLAGSDASNSYVVMRYTSTGSLDTSFSADGVETFNIGIAGPRETATDVLVQADGKIVVVGVTGVARLDADGSLDTSFSGDGKIDITPLILGYSGALDAAGHLVVAASASDGAGFGIARFTTAGELDASFSGDGIVTTPFGGDREGARTVVPLPDGKVLAAGLGNETTAVARYLSNGSPDTSFSADGKQTTSFPGLEDQADGVVVQPDGKFLVAGSANWVPNSSEFAVARFNPNGSLDTSFSGDGKVTTDFGGPDFVRAVALQPDGKIVAVGRIGSFLPGGTESLAVARYNPDGSLDTTFSSDGKYTAPDSAGAGVAIQSNGSIVIVGAAGDGDGDFYVTRLAADGSLDTNFGSAGVRRIDFGDSDVAAAVAVDGDGKVTVAGTQGATGAFAIARLTANGNLDPTFSGDGKQTTKFGAAGDGAAVGGLAADPSGTVTVVGTTESTTAVDFALARYTSAGDLDTTFSGDGKQTTDFGSDDRANAVVRQPDGRLLVAGGIGNSFGLARYLPDGDLDLSFSSGGRQIATFPGTTTAAINDLALQADGAVIAVGYVTGSGSLDTALARWTMTSDPVPDTHAPTITISAPTEGQHFAQGQQVTARVSCQDDRSDGLAACDFPPAVDTSSAGLHAFTATADDKAGNHSSATVHYVVDAPTAEDHPPDGGGSGQGGGGSGQGGGGQSGSGPTGSTPIDAGSKPADQSSAPSVAPVRPSVTLPSKVSATSWVAGVRVTLAKLRPQSKLTLTIRSAGKTLKTITRKVKPGGRANIIIKLPAAMAKRLKHKTVQIKVRAVGTDGSKATITKTLAVQ